MQRLLCLAVPVGGLFLYLYTAYPEPSWIDSGALAAASHMLDIPHPTGKQLYVLLSRLAVIVFPGSFFPLTLFSALSVAIGLWMLGRAHIWGNAATPIAASVAVMLVLAASPLVWAEATVNEVHALQILLFSLFLFSWFREVSLGRSVMLAYLASLAFSTHGTAIFLAPFLLHDLWQNRRRVRVLAMTVLAALMGLTLYLYLPIRSAAGAVLDWGGTSTWDGFWRYVTGWQYSVWMGGGTLADLRYAIDSLKTQIWGTFPWLLLPLSLYGLWAAWRHSRQTFWITLAAFLLCLAFSLNYHIPDIEAYFLLAAIIMAVWVGIGVDHAWTRRPLWGLIALGAVAASLVPAWPAHFRAMNHREWHVATDWVRDALVTVEPNAVILSREWDHVSPALYLRFVLGDRPDVLWIDTELLRRSWYREYIRRADPKRYERAKAALDRLAPQIALFESGAAYDANEIERAYADAIYALSLGQEGPVYVDWGMDRTYLRDVHEAPWGLIMRAFRSGETVPPLPAWPAYRNLKVSFADSPRTEYHLGLYSQALLARTTYTRAMQQP